MFIISKAKTAKNAQNYYRNDYSNRQEIYLKSEGKEEILGQWQGLGAEELGLKKDVNKQDFENLLCGRHSINDKQLIAKRGERKLFIGDKVRIQRDRAGWDGCFSAPKSVSLQAIIGEDKRVELAHKKAVSLALSELEKYAQARMGGNRIAETTEKLIISKFEHYSDRPVKHPLVGYYEAPQLHTHCFIMNMTITKEGKYRSLQPKELFSAQSYIKTLYHMKLAEELQKIGYEVEKGKYQQVEIVGYSKQYLEANSPRRKQILTYLAGEDATDKNWAAKTYRAAITTRNKKVSQEKQLMKEKGQQLAALYGNQPQRLYQEALNRGKVVINNIEEKAQQAVTFSLEKNNQTGKVFELSKFLTDAYQQALGETTLAAIHKEINNRQALGELKVIRTAKNAVVITKQHTELAKQNSEKMLLGKGEYPLIASHKLIKQELKHRKDLSIKQQQVVSQILTNKDKVVVFESGKLEEKQCCLSAIASTAKLSGYEVLAIASSKIGVKTLNNGQIPTIEMKNLLDKDVATNKKFYIVEDKALGSVLETKKYLSKLQQEDRLVIVSSKGVNQFDSAKSLLQLQDINLQRFTVKKEEINLSRTLTSTSNKEDIVKKLEELLKKGQIIEIPKLEDRKELLAKQFAKEPNQSLIFSTNHKERERLNSFIYEQQQRLQIDKAEKSLEYQVDILKAKQITNIEKKQAANYSLGETIKYERTSKVYNIEKGTYGQIVGLDKKENWLVVKLKNGQVRSYNPPRLSGVTIYQSEQRSFALGTRVEFKEAFSQDMRTKIAKGELGQVIKLDESLAKIELDKGKQVEIELRKWPHLDYGYATEKVSPQLAQKYQILVNVETNQPDGKTKKALLELIESHKSSNAVKIYVDNQERLKNALLEAKQGLSISNPKQELVEGKESILEAKNIGLPKTKQEKLIEIYQAGIKIEKEPIVIDRQKGESIETLKETGISESTNQEISQPATLSNISEKQKATSKAIEIEM